MSKSDFLFLKSSNNLSERNCLALKSLVSLKLAPKVAMGIIKGWKESVDIMMGGRVPANVFVDGKLDVGATRAVFCEAINGFEGMGGGAVMFGESLLKPNFFTEVFIASSDLLVPMREQVLGKGADVATKLGESKVDLSYLAFIVEADFGETIGGEEEGSKAGRRVRQKGTLGGRKTRTGEGGAGNSLAARSCNVTVLFELKWEGKVSWTMMSEETAATQMMFERVLGIFNKEVIDVEKTKKWVESMGRRAKGEEV